jgi:hypothetical protein
MPEPLIVIGAVQLCFEKFAPFAAEALVQWRAVRAQAWLSGWRFLFRARYPAGRRWGDHDGTPNEPPPEGEFWMRAVLTQPGVGGIGGSPGHGQSALQRAEERKLLFVGFREIFSAAAITGPAFLFRPGDLLSLIKLGERSREAVLCLPAQLRL